MDPLKLSDKRPLPTAFTNNAKGPNTGTLGGSLGSEGSHQKAAFGLIDTGDSGVWPNHPAVFNQLRHKPAERSNGNCETDSRTLARMTCDCGCHADEQTARIEQGASGIPRVNRGIGLNN